MSVQKMQLVNILGQADNFEKTADKIYENPSFHPELSKDFLNKFDSIHAYETRNPNEHYLSRALEVLTSAGIEPQYEDFSQNKKTLEEIDSYFENLSERIIDYENKKTELTSAVSKYQSMIGNLTPLAHLDTPLEELFGFTYIVFRFGKMPVASYEKYKLFILENEDVFFFPFLDDKKYVWGMYVSPRASVETADGMFDSLNFERISLPVHIQGTPGTAIEMLRKEVAEFEETAQKLTKEHLAFLESEKQEILSCYSKIRKQYEVYNLKKHAAHSDNSFYLLGWVPKNESEQFINSFEENNDILCVPVEEDSEEVQCNTMPPTKLKNFVLFRPFETFLGMYALPSYNEFDPTPLMAITYSLLFGIMFGDVGQGAVLLLGGLFMGLVKKIDLGKIIATVGVFSIIFGFVYGSVFGYEDILPFGFKTMHNSETINFTLMGAVVLGMLCIVVVMLVNIANGIKQKNFEKILFDYNGVAGLMLYVGIIAILMVLFNIGGNLFTVPFVIIFLVIPLILIFLREPLGNLVARKKDWMPKNIGEYVLENFFELFEILLSFVTNTISFIRVGAFALSHAGMMMVVFILAQGTAGNQNMAVVIIGNIVVIGLEGLIVGIQVLRLHYYEFFSRFYDGEGREFTPVKINYNKNSF